MISVNIKSEALTELQAKAAKLNQAGEAALVAGRAVRQLLIDHFTDLDSTHANTMGGERTHFWAKVAKSTSVPEPEAGGVAITINQVGFAQRWLGGDIKAGGGTSSATGSPTKYLAIPARAEAYGKSPGEFDDLEFIPFASGKRGRGGMLVELYFTSITGKNGKPLKNPSRGAAGRTQGSLVMFWLVPVVHQTADPSVMPTTEEMTQTATEAVGGFVTRLLAQP